MQMLHDMLAKSHASYVPALNAQAAKGSVSAE